MRTPRATFCGACRHADRGPIELALARHVSLRAIARRFGVNKDILHRHSIKHLPDGLKRALAAKSLVSDADLGTLRVEESRSLLERLVHQRADLLTMIEQAKEDHDFNGANSLHKTLQRNFELCARLLGQFVTQDQVVVNNLTISPQYLELRAALMRALYHHPQARTAVLAELRALESKAPTSVDVALVTPLEESLTSENHDG